MGRRRLRECKEEEKEEEQVDDDDDDEDADEDVGYANMSWTNIIKTNSPQRPYLLVCA